MKAYKGFNKDMTCRGFQFEEGQTYHEDEAKLCESGFHACENPLDCFGYYNPAESVFHEVELDEVSPETHSDDTKRCGKTIKIKARLDIAGICKAHFEYVKSHTTHEVTAGDSNSASAGESGSASAGDCGSASAGYRGSASAGNCGSASAGDYGSASAGDCGSASAGDCGSASAGYYGSASAGNCGSASAGYRGSAVSRGDSSVKENGCAVVRGSNVKARGGIGSVIVIVIENDDYNIKEWKSGIIDGEILKPDTWYTLKDGEFVEAD